MIGLSKVQCSEVRSVEEMSRSALIVRSWCRLTECRASHIHSVGIAQSPTQLPHTVPMKYERLLKQEYVLNFCGTCIYQSKVQTFQGLKILHDIDDRYTYFMHSRYLKWNACDKIKDGWRSTKVIGHGANGLRTIRLHWPHHRICRRVRNNKCQILMTLK